MKKYALAVLVLLSIALVASQDLGIQQLRAELGKPIITKIGALGKGMAISITDPLDFKIAKIGLVQVQVNFSGQILNRDTGLLWLDEEKYQLKNATIEKSAVSADVYLNGSLIGIVNLALVQKNDTPIWVGKLSINSKEYNLYLLEG
ncbi:MAG: hypothetical protein QXZ43_04590, partial [Candidatus Aenigmatarchaeota archaeon]